MNGTTGHGRAIWRKTGNETAITISNFPLSSLSDPCELSLPVVLDSALRSFSRHPPLPSRPATTSGNIAATPPGGRTALNRTPRRGREAKALGLAPGERADSLANFQIYTLALRSRAACFAATSVTFGSHERIEGWFLLSVPVPFRSCTNVCVCVCVYIRVLDAHIYVAPQEKKKEPKERVKKKRH